MSAGGTRGTAGTGGVRDRCPSSPPRAWREDWISLRTIAIAAILAVPGGCTSDTTGGASVRVVDSAGVRIATIGLPPSSLRIWTLAPTAELVLNGAETGDSTAFAQVGPVRWLSNGGLVVADAGSQRLLVFDAGGRLVRTLGRRGDGPGEFRRLDGLAVWPGDTLTTFDPRQRRLSVWHPDTGLVRSMNLAGDGSFDSWPADAWLWRGAVVVFQLSLVPLDSVPAGSGVRRWPTRAQLALRDTSGRTLIESARFDGPYSGLVENGDVRLPFANRPFVAVSRDRVHFGSGSVFEITSLDTAFRPAGIIRWPAQSEPLEPGEIARLKAELDRLLVQQNVPPGPRTALNQSFAPEILPDERPAIGRVFAGADGRLWAERFEPVRLGTALQTPGDRWTILEADGAPVATLRLPALTRLEDVRGDRVVVVQRDSLDVQTVAIFRIQRR